MGIYLLWGVYEQFCSEYMPFTNQQKEFYLTVANLVIRKRHSNPLLSSVLNDGHIHGQGFHAFKVMKNRN